MLNKCWLNETLNHTEINKVINSKLEVKHRKHGSICIRIYMKIEDILLLNKSVYLVKAKKSEEYIDIFIYSI